MLTTIVIGNHLPIKRQSKHAVCCYRMNDDVEIVHATPSDAPLLPTDNDP